MAEASAAASAAVGRVPTSADESPSLGLAAASARPSFVASPADATYSAAVVNVTGAPSHSPAVSATEAPVLASSDAPNPTDVSSPSPAANAPEVATPTPSVTPISLATAIASVTPTAIASATPSASILPSSPAPAARRAATAPRLDRRTRRKLGKIVSNTVNNKGVAGLQVAVRLPSGETWLGTAGNAEYSPARALRDDTQFSIASISKTFVAALILKFVDEGKIDLDAPFGRYFDDAPRSKNVSIRQLLSHTSGIYNYFENPRYGKAAAAWLQTAPTGQNSREHRWTYSDIMGLVKPGYCKPGKCYHYSNTNYVILGKVAEAVGGDPLDKQLRQRFFKPLGLKDTIYQPAQQPAGDAAHGHWRNLDGSWNDHTRRASVLPFLAAVTAADAAGSIASTARDLSVWAEALYGGEVLSRRSLREMTTILSAGTYGLGTDVAVFSGNRGLGHRGGLRGFESSMWYFPASDVSVVLLSNQGNWLTDVPMGKLVRAVLGKR